MFVMCVASSLASGNFQNERQTNIFFTKSIALPTQLHSPGKYVKGDDAKVHETFALQLLKLRGVYRTLIDMASEGVDLRRHPSLARPCTSG